MRRYQRNKTGIQLINERLSFEVGEEALFLTFFPSQIKNPIHFPNLPRRTIFQRSSRVFQFEGHSFHRGREPKGRNILTGVRSKVANGRAIYAIDQRRDFTEIGGNELIVNLHLPVQPFARRIIFQINERINEALHDNRIEIRKRNPRESSVTQVIRIFRQR